MKTFEKQNIPVYSTGIEAVRKTGFTNGFEVVSQYGFCLKDGFPDLSSAIEAAHEERQRIWDRYSNKEDAPEFIESFIA